MMRRECEVYPKHNYDSTEEIKENNNYNKNKNNYYYYKKLFRENGKLDDMFDFE